MGTETKVDSTEKCLKNPQKTSTKQLFFLETSHVSFF